MTDIYMNEIKIVPSGSFYSGRTQPAVLQAFLGSCVGVTIYDKVAQVGGMAHFLLPKPISESEFINPDKYASTGLPVFLDQLRELGATNQNMEATIAGGAMVGSISELDMSLNIGGRTAEVVKSILSDEGIQISFAETGGLIACRLDLDLETGKASAQPTLSGPDRSMLDFIKPDPGEIDTTLKNVKPIPQVALKILRMINEGEYDIKKLSAEIKKDQVISAKTLQLCNTAFFNRRGSIDSLEDAILILGQDIIIKSVISVCVRQFFVQPKSSYSLCQGDLYHHALGTAIICERLAARTGIAQPSSAYTAGLLHDIGMVVIDQHMPPESSLFYKKMREQKSGIISAERKLLGIDHCEAGARLAKSWELPETIECCISYHHLPERSDNRCPIVHLVHIADFLMARFYTGMEIELIDVKHLKNRLNSIGLSPGEFIELVDMIPTRTLKAVPELAMKS